MASLTEALTRTLLAPFGQFWPQDWNASLGGASTVRAANVTPDSAMSVMTYYSGVRFIAETTASLPLIVYERLKPKGKERAPEHPMYAILHDQANPEMTAFTWRETKTAHVVSWGNGYSERQLDGGGRTIAMWPLRPDRMRVYRTGGKLWYDYRLPSGEIKTLPSERMFHVRGLGYDGLVGYSPIEIMRRALRLSMAAEEYGERTFDNDARPGVILTHPKTLSDKARDNLEKGWARNHEGLTNAQRTAVLEEGVTVSEIGFPPKDTQFLETRKFQTIELARGLRLPPHILYELDRSTNNNIEHQGLELVNYSLRSWLVRIEQQINMDLITDRRFFAEHLLDALLRGDALTRSQALWIQRQGGALSQDEWREIENRNPLPDGAGEEFLRPLNMAASGSQTPATGGDPTTPPGSVPKPGGGVDPATLVPDTSPLTPTQPSKNGHSLVAA